MTIGEIFSQINDPQLNYQKKNANKPKNQKNKEIIQLNCIFVGAKSI